MIFQGVEICCPKCRGELSYGGQGYQELGCVSCRSSFPIILGIPDLRIFPDPYIDIDEDRAKGLKLAEHLDEVSFAELIDYYYSITSVVTAKQARQYSRGLIAAKYRSQTVLDKWMSASSVDGYQTGGRLLEIGCGTGPLLVNAAKHFEIVVGIDIAFRWLVVAKKRLQEVGLEVPLICACAEALPFPDQTFDTVAAESALENLEIQPKALNECYRVLGSPGNLWVSTPNKYSLGPDPQTGIWASGFLPEQIVATIVSRQGGIPPKRSMVSARSLDKLLRSAEFREVQFMLTDVSKKQREQFGMGLQFLVDVYTLASRMSVSRGILLSIGPTILATALKLTN